MLALAVMLIVIGALVSALVVVRSGNKQAYLVLTRDVRVGQQISAHDIGVTNMAVGSGAVASGISADKRAAIVGEYATTNLYAGSVAAPRMFTRQPPVPDDAAVAGVVVGATQMPAGGIGVGDIVQVISVSKSGDNSQSVTLEPAVRVTAVSVSSESTRVSLLIPAKDAEAIAAAAAAQNIALVELPPSTTPVVGAVPARPDASAGSGT